MRGEVSKKKVEGTLITDGYGQSASAITITFHEGVYVVRLYDDLNSSYPEIFVTEVEPRRLVDLAEYPCYEKGYTYTPVSYLIYCDGREILVAGQDLYDSDGELVDVNSFSRDITGLRGEAREEALRDCSYPWTWAVS